MNPSYIQSSSIPSFHSARFNLVQTDRSRFSGWSTEILQTQLSCVILSFCAPICYQHKVKVNMGEMSWSCIGKRHNTGVKQKRICTTTYFPVFLMFLMKTKSVFKVQIRSKPPYMKREASPSKQPCKYCGGNQALQRDFLILGNNSHQPLFCFTSRFQ